MLKQSEGHITHRVREVDAFIPPLPHHASLSVCWSLHLVTMPVALSIFSLPPTSPNKTKTHTQTTQPYSRSLSICLPQSL
jgi:hypothetical protein